MDCKEWTKCISEAIVHLADESIIGNSENELSIIDKPVDVGMNIDYATCDKEGEDEKKQEVDS